ncbi:hypothetical protein [Nocardia stercoris]|nr:hypothetical protein [Nocardia stercoris]
MLMVGVASVSAACAGGSGDSATSSVAVSSTTRRLEAAPQPDPASPDGVAVAALREIYTWHPADEMPGASLERARKWLGPNLIRILDTPASDAGPKPSLQWGDWARARAQVEAFTFASGEKAPPGADPDHQQYKIGIEQTAVYPDGHRDQLAPATVIATVVRTADGWRLDEFH